MKPPILTPPSAWLPIAMSALALMVVGAHLLVVGTAREPDEGAAAHLWQLMMAGQVPVIAWFLLHSPATAWRQAMAVLAVQLAAMLVAAAPVALFGL